MSEERARQLGLRGDPPSHVGIGQTFAGQRLVMDPASLAGVDVAVVGAPFDDGTSTARARASARGRSGRPTTAATPGVRIWRSGLDPFAVLDVVDYGDAAVAPGDLLQSHARARRTCCARCSAPGAMPFVLGGDHSLSLPTLQVLGETFGPDGYAVVHFDTHADTAAELYGVRISHGTPFRVAVEDGHLLGAQHRPDRAARHLARPGRLRLDARGGLPLAHDGRDRRARARRRRRRRDRARARRARRGST